MGKSQREKGARFEREVAQVFGTERVGSRGKPDATHSDVEHESLFIQCKRRARLALYQWWEETVEGAVNAGKVPLLVIRQDRGEALVVMDLKTFRKAMR